jgi:hypothetical protein
MKAPDSDLVFNSVLRGKRNEVSEKIRKSFVRRAVELAPAREFHQSAMRVGPVTWESLDRD